MQYITLKSKVNKMAMLCLTMNEWNWISNLNIFQQDIKEINKLYSYISL